MPELSLYFQGALHLPSILQPSTSPWKPLLLFSPVQFNSLHSEQENPPPPPPPPPPAKRFHTTAVSCEIQMKASGNRFFLVFALIIHFMATTTKAKRCIFISRTPKCPGAGEAGGAGRRYRLFSALLRSQFGPI